MSLSSHHREIVKKTVPVLREHGQTITKTFYRDLLSAHPELNHVFNPANQRDGAQANSLAAAVLTYAEHIDQPEQLSGMLQRITNKHSSLAVKPEHYPIVGKHLLGAIQNVLGAAATPEIVEAWGAAYNQLAEIMIQHEAALSDLSAAAPGGWRDFEPFRVERKVAESEVITSFYLTPADDAPLPAFEPGQYISIKIQPSKAQPPAFPFTQIRQYSISCAPNDRHYRISVRREAAPGQVSNYLHDRQRRRFTADPRTVRRLHIKQEWPSRRLTKRRSGHHRHVEHVGASGRARRGYPRSGLPPCHPQSRASRIP
jgi:nitric oxide dioxygenase